MVEFAITTILASYYPARFCGHDTRWSLVSVGRDELKPRRGHRNKDC